MTQWIDNNNDQFVEDNNLQWFSDVTTYSGTADLGSFLRSFVQSYSDMGSNLNSVPPVDLPASLQGWDTKNLQSLVNPIPSVDLNAILNVIEIRDLPATITGDLWHGSKDLGAEFYKIFLRGHLDLQSSIRSSWDIVDLSAYLKAIYYFDLQGVIQPNSPKDLLSLIYGIPSVDLGVAIHGWDTKDLGATLIGGYGPGDIQSYIYGVPAVDLPAYISGFQGIQIPFDLRSIITSWYTKDLPASIYPLKPVDLGAYINAVGQSFDLRSIIVPKTIMLKQVIQVSLLEHKDLKGLINFQCFGSGYKDLPSYLHILQKLDLTSIICGWYTDTDRMRDLISYINVRDYTTQDIYTINFFSEVQKYTQLNIRFNANDIYTVFDTIGITFGNSKDLPSYINGTLSYLDLTSYITPIVQANFTELPPYVNPKTHQVVIDFNDKWQENWRRFVEIMFNREGKQPYHYFYVGGTNMVYKIDRSRHWTIWAKSYIETNDELIERRSVRKKYIFKMSDYDTVDHAIRDLIDRVSTYRVSDIGASIVGVLGPHKDLSASIQPVIVHKWMKNLLSSITGV